MHHARIAVVSALALLAAPVLAVADGTASPPAARAPARAPRRHVVVYGEIPVPGEIQRPQQFDLTSRSSSGYVHATDETHFAPQVVTATRRAPF